MGVFSLVARTEPDPFTQRQIELVQTFADQAVIAIENVRLFDEVQARTRDLTRVAAAADRDRRRAQGHQPLGVRPADRARHAGRSRRRCFAEADRAAILRLSDNRFQLVATHGFPPEFQELMFARGLDLDRGIGCTDEWRSSAEWCRFPISWPIRNSRSSRAKDAAASAPFSAVPLLREGNPDRRAVPDAGAVAPFTEQQIELVTTFADQAVIAIENVRLFNEIQAKTRDLTEALTYQTGSSNILKVIARSPSDVEPVFRQSSRAPANRATPVTTVVYLREGDELVMPRAMASIPEGMQRASH